MGSSRRRGALKVPLSFQKTRYEPEVHLQTIAVHGDHPFGGFHHHLRHSASHTGQSHRHDAPSSGHATGHPGVKGPVWARQTYSHPVRHLAEGCCPRRFRAFHPHETRCDGTHHGEAACHNGAGSSRHRHCPHPGNLHRHGLHYEKRHRPG